MPRPQDISWRKSQQAQAAGSPPPPGGPNGLFRTAAATPPPDEGDHWEPGPTPQCGRTYIVLHWPTMDAINQSMDHGYLLSPSQIQVSFEIEELGEIYFGMMGKKRHGPSEDSWQMDAATTASFDKLYYAIFNLDFYQKVGTVVFIG